MKELNSGVVGEAFFNTEAKVSCMVSVKAEYYYRRDNKYYFRNVFNKLNTIMIETEYRCDEIDKLKRGDIVTMEFTQEN